MARVAAENVPEELKQRLLGTAGKEMTSESAVIRQILDAHLPPLKEVKKFIPERHKCGHAA